MNIVNRTFTGEVIRGFGRGSGKIGFPTANIDPSSWNIEIGEQDFGVYCGLVSVHNNVEKFCVFSIGKNPTFQLNCPTFEVHILDFDEDIYGEIISVKVLKYLRPMRAFKGVEELKYQITKDAADSREYLEKLLTKNDQSGH